MPAARRRPSRAHSYPRASWWALAGALALALPCVAAARPPAIGAEELQVGERIYRDGILPGGDALTAQRTGDPDVRGKAAACVNCHRRSGLGSLEERVFIPPITAKYLFRSVVASADEMTDTASDTTGPKRSRYTAATLARSLRDGVDADGRPFNYLMPRYPLDEASMHALIGYLRQLSRGAVRGVGDTTLDFATIIAPDADPTARRDMLDVLGHCFGSGGAFNQGNASMQARALQNRGARAWHLHVWELTGPSDGWEEQLRRHLAAEPVFGVVSGLGGRDWAPVHRFCQQESLPCVLPNVDLPVDAEDDFYPLYFSKGVLLEAELIASRLRPAGQDTRRVLQIYRGDDVGAAAADRLEQAGAGLDRQRQVLGSGPPARALARALGAARDHDAVVLWLRRADVAALPAKPPPGIDVYLSGIMAGLEAAPLPPAWRERVLMTYPYELPTRRGVNMDYARGWFAFHHIAPAPDAVQTNTYVACGVLTEAAGLMLDNLSPDYLVEVIENQLGHRVVNGYFSRLGLAAGQRFASKGGYLVRFVGATGTTIAADGEWTVP